MYFKNKWHSPPFQLLTKFSLSKKHFRKKAVNRHQLLYRYVQFQLKMEDLNNIVKVALN